jgi:hypothetical protein
MDVPPDNTLPNPYSDNAAETGQPVFPWRGRITCSPAAGFAGTVDKTATAAMQVAALFGAATPASFSVSGQSVWWTGAAGDWGLRRMVLHYAHLCAAAGGVDAFLIGTEMPGLTTIRSGASTYPAVQAYRDLLGDVRSILGAGTKIGYAADWSEYFGHQAGRQAVAQPGIIQRVHHARRCDNRLRGGVGFTKPGGQILLDPRVRGRLQRGRLGPLGREKRRRICLRHGTDVAIILIQRHLHDLGRRSAQAQRKQAALGGDTSAQMAGGSGSRPVSLGLRHVFQLQQLRQIRLVPDPKHQIAPSDATRIGGAQGNRVRPVKQTVGLLLRRHPGPCFRDRTRRARQGLPGQRPCAGLRGALALPLKDREILLAGRQRDRKALARR